MKWYLAKVVYRIVCGNGNHTPQFDEQLRLIAALNEIEAFDKASSVGRSEQETFYNQQRQMVKWQFVNVSELYRLNELIDGAELYSRIKEVEDAEAYATFVNGKAQSIQQHQTHHLLNLV